MGEIRRMNEALSEHRRFGQSNDFIIYPLHSTMSSENQGAVFGKLLTVYSTATVLIRWCQISHPREFERLLLRRTSQRLVSLFPISLASLVSSLDSTCSVRFNNVLLDTGKHREMRSVRLLPALHLRLTRNEKIRWKTTDQPPCRNIYCQKQCSTEAWSCRAGSKRTMLPPVHQTPPWHSGMHPPLANLRYVQS